MKCPVCDYKVTYCDLIPSQSIQPSLLYENIYLAICEYCGHGFNVLEEGEKLSLKKYYQDEYIRNKFSPTEIKNNFSGFLDEKKYNLIVSPNKISDYVEKILFFNEKFFIPSEKKIDLIAIDHALEHCWNINTAVENISGISDNSTVYVQVPDFGEYQYHMFPYCLLIKEHVQHFTSRSIKTLFSKHGFECVHEKKMSLNLFSGQVSIPSREYVFKPSLKSRTGHSEQSGAVYGYGTGRELLYYLDVNKIAAREFTGFIDDMQGGKTINGKPIYSHELLSTLSRDDTIVITSLFHTEGIYNKIIASGFEGNIKYI